MMPRRHARSGSSSATGGAEDLKTVLPVLAPTPPNSPDSGSAALGFARDAQAAALARIKAASAGFPLASALVAAEVAQRDIGDLLELGIAPGTRHAAIRRISVAELLVGTRWGSAVSDVYVWASIEVTQQTLFPCLDRSLSTATGVAPALAVIAQHNEPSERLGLRFQSANGRGDAFKHPLVALVHVSAQAVMATCGGSATIEWDAAEGPSVTLWFSTTLSPPTAVPAAASGDGPSEARATGTLSPDDPRYVEVMMALGQSRNLLRAPSPLIGHVLAEATLVEYGKDAVLMHEGDTDTDAIFLLVKGALEVSKDGRYIATFAEPGDLMGEVAAFSGGARLVRVAAVMDSTLIRLSHRRFASFRETSPERYEAFVSLILFSLTEKIRVLTERVKTYENVVAGPPGTDEPGVVPPIAQLNLEERLREIVLYSHVVASSQDAVVVTDPEGAVVMLNPAARQLFSLPETGLPSLRPSDLLPFMAGKFEALWRRKAVSIRAEGVLHAADDLGGGVLAGVDQVVEVTAGGVMMQERLIAYSILVRNITATRELARSLEASREALEAHSKRLEALVAERTRELSNTNASLLQTNDKLTGETREKDLALRKLQETQAFLLQSEKMSALGQLAAGVAHEINNPMGFVYSNLNAFQEYFAVLTRVLSLYAELDNASVPVESPAAGKLAAVRAYKQQQDYDYIMRDSPVLIADSIDGASRVVAIVQNLKEFSRVDSAKKEWANLNAGIDSTLKIIWNELKYKAEIQKDYGEIPEIECYPQQLNQVFLNLLVNAAQAIDKFGKISVRTWREEAGVAVAFSDTGSGIAPDHLNRIFEPFFTTKPVGKGTGLGLSVVYNLVRQHQGRIEVQSELGRGTTFTVHLPAQFSDESDNTKP